MKSITNKKYKRFMVFHHMHYEESGGIWDCDADYENVEEAYSYIEKMIEREKESRYYSGNFEVYIFDRQEGYVIDLENIK